MDYATYKAARAAIEARVEAASARLKAIPGVGSGRMGPTPDAVKATPEWRDARHAFNVAFAALRDLNGRYARQFARQERQERAARRNA